MVRIPAPTPELRDCEGTKRRRRSIAKLGATDVAVAAETGPEEEPELMLVAAGGALTPPPMQHNIRIDCLLSKIRY